MIRKTFRYCPTHKEDERYMQQMCSQGWAAVRLQEGFWTFESCQKDQYCYRIGYLRGMNREAVQQWIDMLAAQEIEFVSRYSFWAIFRSEHPFELYTPETERKICRKMFAPMPIGALISWIVCAVLILLCLKTGPLFAIPAAISGFYGGMCSWLGWSYYQLLKEMSDEKKYGK